jgi:thiopeptide-type bacteriocin biosynthesis protein
MVEPPALFNVVQLLKSLTRPYIEQDLVWKVQVDSYQREIERYGAGTMTLAEDLFFHDSRMIVAMLDMIAGDEGEKYRWLFAVRALDMLLDDFRFELEQKCILLSVLKENFGREFGINKSLRDQLKTRYRDEREAVDVVLDRSQDEGSEMKPLFDLLADRTRAIRPIVNDILEAETSRDNRKQPHLNDLVGSYIHMMLNRLFRSKQRVHELVTYDFLWNVYRSDLARQKFAK